MAGWSYERSGVSIARGDAASEDAFRQLSRTFNDQTVLEKGLVSLKAAFADMEEPLITLASDGVGTKLKYAFASGRHNTVGIDLVAMCVNDLARNNIRPLGFALYRATSRIILDVMQNVVEGVVEGCLQAGCVYMTGETAEMPDFYREGEYDLAGFAVGVFDRKKLITGEAIREDDKIFGLPSSGLHSNGYSLVRRLFPPERVGRGHDALLNQLLKPTRIYVREVLGVNQRFEIHGWAHVTGGGIVGKLGKILPSGLQAVLSPDSWPEQPIFATIRKKGNVPIPDMRRTFNLGLGMIGISNPTVVDEVISYLHDQGEEAYIVGEVVKAGDEEQVLFS